MLKGVEPKGDLIVLRRYFTVRALSVSAVTAALYTALCLLLPSISYGMAGIDVRVS